MSGHLDELLRSPGSQPVRCVATAPGHVVVSVAGGKYLHAFSARTPRPARVGATPTEPTLAPSFSLAPNERDERSRSSLERTERSWEDDDRAWERTEESFLSFHGASRVARVVFVPPDASNATPLALLAAQEDGGVAAWRWCCEDTEPEPRWVPCAPPAFAGGPPLVAAPFDDAYVTENGFVFDAALLAARAAGVRLACLTPRPSTSGSMARARGTPRNADARRDRRRLPGRCPRGRLRRAPARGNGGEKRARDATGLSPGLLRGPPPRRGGALRGGGDSSGSSRAERGVQTKIPSSRGGPPASPVRRATRRVDLPSPRASPTPRRRAGRPRPRGGAGNFRKFPGVSGGEPSDRTRLATCLHSPSHELLAVTERGNVLCLSPGLRGFDAEASVSQASENENKHRRPARQASSRRRFRRERRFRGDGAHGPRRRYPPGRSRRSTFTRSSRVAVHQPRPQTWADDTASIEKRQYYAKREKSRRRLSRVPSELGVALTVPSRRRAAASGSGDATEEDSSWTDSSRLVDGGAARALVTAARTATPPACSWSTRRRRRQLARAYVGRGIESKSNANAFLFVADRRGRARERNGLSDEGPTDRSSPIGVSVASLRAARRECAWFGGALEHLDASAALAQPSWR